MRFWSSWMRWALARGIAAIAWIGMPALALAQEAGDTPVIGTATLPRDLSPWGMYINADPVVKAVLIGLAFASLVTWTVWLAKTIEIVVAKRRVRAALERARERAIDVGGRRAAGRRRRARSENSSTRR